MRVVLIGPLLLFLAACAVGPDYRPPHMDLTPQFVGAPAIDDRTSYANWWLGFDDPFLVTLIDQALKGNTDLAQVAARLDQSRSAAKTAGAALLPAVDVAPSVEAVHQSLGTPFGAASELLGLPRDYTQYSVGAEASWELDVFGALRRGREAARADLAAAHANLDAMKITVAAETADAYLALCELQVRLAIAQQQEGNEQQLVDLIQRRVAKEISSDRELNRATAELEYVRATMPPLRAALTAQRNRLSVLVGEQPGTGSAALAFAQTIPVAPVPSGSNRPADLLRRRPDVVAAERRLAASNARIGVAIADYYPHVSLSGLIGVASAGTGGLFSGNSLEDSAGAGVRWRLLDFGRVDAEVALARGRQAEALAAWRGTVLQATEDVETSLNRLSESHRECQILTRQVSALTKARDQTRKAYSGGVVALIDVLDADRALLSASARLATVRAEEARAAVVAYRALGGGWQARDSLTLASAAGSH